MQSVAGNPWSEEVQVKLQPIKDILRPRRKQKPLIQEGNWPINKQAEADFTKSDETWWKRFSISQKGKQFLKAGVSFLILPGIMALVGLIVESQIYGGDNTTTFHTKMLTFSGLIAAPFVLIRWCWPWQKHTNKLELVFYVLHTTSFLATTLTTIIDGKTVYFISDQVRTVFAGNSYTSIVASQDVYTYLDEFLKTVYDDSFSFNKKQRQLPGRLMLVSPIRLKQSRVKKRPCSGLPNVFGELLCYDQFSLSSEDTQPFSELNFTYRNPGFLNYASDTIYASDISTLGQLGSYPLSGFWVLWPQSLDISSALDMLNALKNASWIDDQTRQISLDFVVVNKDLPSPIVTTVVLTVEVNLAGKFLPLPPQMSFGYFKHVLISFDEGDNKCDSVTTQRQFLFPLYIGVSPIFIYTLISLLLRCYCSWRIVLRSLSSYVEAAWIIVVFLAFYFRWQSIYYAHCNFYRFNQTLWPTTDQVEVELHEFLPLAERWQSARQMVAVALFLYTLDSLKFFTKLSGFDAVGRTLSYGFAHLASFAISFAVTFLSFALMFYLLYSASDDDYQSFPRTVTTVWLVLLGNIELNKNSFLGHETQYIFLIIIFTFFLVFILLTIIIAIISEAFEKTRGEEQEVRRKRRQMYRAALTRLRRYVGGRYGNNVIENDAVYRSGGETLIPLENMMKI